MGGISGVLTVDGSMANEADLRRVNQLLSHRGPNGKGIYLDRELGLGNTRLATLDLSDAGEQPMPALGDRYWITFNGEIYNFLELKKELKGLGYPFKTETDTEVILASWIAWGPDCVKQFNGMWAFAIWDSQERKLFLSRDRFGIKPLYFYYDERLFAFSSEIKGFLGFEGIRLILSNNGIATHLAFPDTIYASKNTAWNRVFRLLPGHILTFSASESEYTLQKWWNVLEHLPCIPSTSKGQKERFQELLFDSIHLRLRSDIPLGTCLSGGVNSSSLLALVSQLSNSDSGERITPDVTKSCIVKFSEGDLTEYSRGERFAKQLKVDLALLREGAVDIEEAIFSMIYACETVEPLYLPQWMVYQGLRQIGIRVSMDAYGINETLGAHYGNILNGSFDRVSQLHSLRRALNNPSLWKQYVQEKRLPVTGKVIQESKFDSEQFKKKNYHTEFFSGKSDQEIATNWTEYDLESVGRGRFFQSRVYQSEGGYLQSLLNTVDVSSMAQGVEARTPFLDWRLYCYCLALPVTACVQKGQNKFVMREAMRGVVPDKILDRRASSTQPSLLGCLQPVTDEIVHSAAFKQYPYFQGKEVIKLVEEKRYTDAWPYVQLFLLDNQFQKIREELFNG